jgi:hypothetical protein
MLRPRNVAASRGSSRRLGARCGPVALLLLAALAPATAVGQRAPQPVFTELFAYDPAVPSQLLGKWLGSQQMPAREDIERQIAVAVVIAEEEAPLLMPVQRVVGGVQVENNLPRRAPVRLQKQIDK